VTAEKSDRLTREELEALYAEHSDELRAFLRGVLRDADLAAEALQMTFVKLIEQGETANRTTFKGWLFKVALNEARGIRRRSRREEKLLRQPVWQTGNETLSLEETLIRQESVEQLRDLIQKLPPEQQTILKLRLRDEITFATIAEQLELPLGTVLTRMRAALKTLTLQLRERES
jgi:RNA polymerase sigma-70 factor (ECF subfamily)